MAKEPKASPPGGQNEVNSQSDMAYRQIKAEILTCALEPSSRVTEAEFVKRYGLGRASIRTALSRLSQEALVEALPRFGYVVAPLSVADARDLFQLQLVLEPAAGRMAAGRVDAQHLIELNDACRNVIHVSDSDDAAAFLRANTNLHAAVAAATGNALMARFVRILYERLQRVLYASGRFDEIVARVAHHHDELVELLIENRGDEAERVVTRQIQHNHQIMLSELSEIGAGLSSSPIGHGARREAAEYG